MMMMFFFFFFQAEDGIRDYDVTGVQTCALPILMMIGGYLYPKTGVALGQLAVAALKNINVRRLIMSVGGITEKGLFNRNALLVETERQMIEAADEVIVVTDSEIGRASCRGRV